MFSSGYHSCVISPLKVNGTILHKSWQCQGFYLYPLTYKTQVLFLFPTILLLYDSFLKSSFSPPCFIPSQLKTKTSSKQVASLLRPWKSSSLPFSVLGLALPQPGAAESSCFRCWDSNQVVTLLKQHMQQMFISGIKRDKSCLVKMGSLEMTKILPLGKAEQFWGGFLFMSVWKA